MFLVVLALAGIIGAGSILLGWLRDRRVARERSALVPVTPVLPMAVAVPTKWRRERCISVTTTK